MENSAAPQAPVGAPLQQSNNASTKQKVSLSPFPHLKNGLSALIKYNLSPALIAILVSSIVSVALTIAFLYALFQANGNFFSSSLFTGSGSSASLVKIIVIFVGVGILAALITGYFGSVVNRIIITGSRKQKEDIGHAFSFVLKRLPQIVLTYLLVVAIFIAGCVVIGVVARIVPILAVLLGLGGMIVALIFLLRISYAPLILVDDENPDGPMAVLRRSGALWSRSGGALVVYALVWLAIYIVFNALLSGHSSTYTGSTGQFDASQLSTIHPAAFSFGLGAVLVSSFISNCFSALVFSGEASIYNDARNLVDGHLPTNAASSGAPAAPRSTSSSQAPLPPSTPPQS